MSALSERAWRVEGVESNSKRHAFPLNASQRIVLTFCWLGIWWGLVLWLGVTILIDRPARPQALTAADPQPIPPAPSPKPPGKPIPPAPTPPPDPQPIPPAPAPSP
ncbi:hypothetical protein NITMOv2_2571 [Nitrospira moscoviensis]|uniref:Uncharacterized protein n=1 Tax=Nitrospira moscoviensis TaxID=42253 RepID=A0A0K2GDQ7_NITMO|nr:hypothetical protein NITMOv2_2571 [Nitrospira moscoviensis]